MLCIYLKNRDPYFCLAAEEYLLKQFNDDIFMLWQSENTVVVGKHQNLLAEINYPYVRENNIKLARRISGGGTVFHDSGNVNFSYIKNVKSPAEISFKIFTQPVLEAVEKLGIKATSSGRNDLLANGLKISGNAEHVFKNRVLHHGTLLFDSDLKKLGNAIKVAPGKYESKAVQSNRSRVANIASFIKKEMTTEKFILFLLNNQLEKRGASHYKLTENDNQNCKRLSEEKFKTWDWIWGYSPKYIFRNKVGINDKTVLLELYVNKGIIAEGKISGNYFTESYAKNLSEKLIGRRHIFDEIQKLLNDEILEYQTELTEAFF